MMLGDLHTHTHTKLLLWVFLKTGAAEYFFFMAVDYLSSSLYNPKAKQTTVCISCTVMKLLIRHRIFHLFTDVSVPVNRPAQKDVVVLQSVSIQ